MQRIKQASQMSLLVVNSQLVDDSAIRLAVFDSPW